MGEAGGPPSPKGDSEGGQVLASLLMEEQPLFGCLRFASSRLQGIRCRTQDVQGTFSSHLTFLFLHRRQPFRDFRNPIRFLGAGRPGMVCTDGGCVGEFSDSAMALLCRIATPRWALGFLYL